MHKIKHWNFLLKRSLKNLKIIKSVLYQNFLRERMAKKDFTKNHNLLAVGTRYKKYLILF